MSYLLRSVSLSIKLIISDPINIFLALIPTVMALCLYIGMVFGIFFYFDQLMLLFQDYLPAKEHATLLAKLLTALLIILIFFIMSWSYVIVVGLIAAPFNSLLSSRIEKKLLQQYLPSSRQDELKKISQGLVSTFLNEFKKLLLIIFSSLIALVLNLFPLLYTLGIFLFSLLLAVQFLDYSWSRHELKFSDCLKDILRNILTYSLPGFVFLLLVTIPLINALIPALATSYFTTLWVQKKYQI